MDVFTYEEASLLIGLEFRLVNALGFEYWEEIFCQRIVVLVSSSWYWRRYAVWLCQAEIQCDVYWKPWSLWSCTSAVTFSFFLAARIVRSTRFTVCSVPVLYETMLLPYKSRITDRCSVPCAVLMYDISVIHFWFGLSALKLRFRRFGYLCSCWLLIVRKHICIW